MEVEQRARHQLGDAAALVRAASPSAVRIGRSKAPLTKLHVAVEEQRAEQALRGGADRDRRCRVSRKQTMSASVACRPRHIASPLPSARAVLGQQLVLLQRPARRPPRRARPCRRPSRRRRRAPRRPGRPRRSGATVRSSTPADRAGDLLGGQDHGDRRRRPWPRAARRAVEVGGAVAARAPSSRRRRGRRRARGRRGRCARAEVRHAHVARRARSGRRWRAQPRGEGLVLERAQRLEAADARVGVGGDGRARRRRSGGARRRARARADGGEPARGVAVAAVEHAGGQRRPPRRRRARSGRRSPARRRATSASWRASQSGAGPGVGVGAWRSARRGARRRAARAAAASIPARRAAPAPGARARRCSAARRPCAAAARARRPPRWRRGRRRARRSSRTRRAATVWRASASQAGADVRLLVARGHDDDGGEPAQRHGAPSAISSRAALVVLVGVVREHADDAAVAPVPGGEGAVAVRPRAAPRPSRRPRPRT